MRAFAGLHESQGGIHAREPEIQHLKLLLVKLHRMQYLVYYALFLRAFGQTPQIIMYHDRQPVGIVPLESWR